MQVSAVTSDSILVFNLRKDEITLDSNDKNLW